MIGRYETPVAAVHTIVAVVAKNKIVVLLNSIPGFLYAVDENGVGVELNGMSFTFYKNMP
jgi:hypothetical protein